MEKSILRKQVLTSRRSIPDEEKAIKSRKICEAVTRSAVYQNADVLYAFIPYNGEPDIKPIIWDAWNAGKIVLVPKVYGDIMEFIKIDSWDELSAGAWGISEPISDRTVEKVLPEAAVMLVPGTAFTPSGDRMGYGRGYYDRYLSDFPIYTIGICYKEQYLAEIPTEVTDKRMNEVIYA